jgi:hypothetical protein
MASLNLNSNNALHLSSHSVGHRLRRTDRRRSAPERKGRWTRCQLWRRQLVTRRTDRNPAGGKSAHDRELVGRRDLSWSCVHTSADVDAHLGPPVGTREGPGHSTGKRRTTADICSGSPTRAGANDYRAGNAAFGNEAIDWRAGDQTSG